MAAAPAHRRQLPSDARFWLGISAAAGVGAVVRFVYLFLGAPKFVKTDGFIFYVDALRLADGLGYTSSLGGNAVEAAHHPPGWTTLLAGVAEAGGRSMRAHQATGLIVGIGLVVVAGLVGRRYAGPRVGFVAACLAAAYPGFWVLEAQILSEPLALLVSGLLMLVLADLWDRPTLARASLAGAIAGALALIRSEQFLLLVIAVIPVLLLNRRTPLRRRLAGCGLASLTAVAVIAPWTAYNLGRFEEPVVLSTNLGFTLLAGNCPPNTYGGELVGSYDLRCILTAGSVHHVLDASEFDNHARRQSLAYARANLDQLPATVVARYGRLLGVFRPSQTVGMAAEWAGSATWPVWAWVVSFWLVAPLAAYGGVLLRRSRTFQWPLLAPLVIVLLVVTAAYGEPRYHTPADLGLLVLAAVAIHNLLPHVRWRRGHGGHSHR